jgi:hypothetical protein
MRRSLLVLCLAVFFAPTLRAQSDFFEAGIYGDYLRLSQTDTNFGGIGARVGLHVLPHVKLEGEMAYDFEQGFTEHLTDLSGNLVLEPSRMHILHGEFGPKVELGHGHIQPFVVAKVGFDKFFIDSCPVSLSCFSSQIANIHSSSVNAVFYPGGGLDAHLGPLGLRFDIGDEMYFNSGTHHNLRMAFGPYIRF